MFVAAHAHGTEGIKVAIRAGVRSIEHGSLIDDEGIELLVEHGTYLVADVYDGDWINEEGAAGGLAGRDDGQERDDDRGPARGLQQGGHGGRSDRLRHRQRGLPARPERDPVRLPGPPGADARSRRSARRRWWRPSAWAGRIGSGRSAPGRFADLVALPADPLAGHRDAAPARAVVKGGARSAEAAGRATGVVDRPCRSGPFVALANGRSSAGRARLAGRDS